MKTHEKDVKSGSLLAFVKRAPAKKPAVVVMKKKEQKPLQAKLKLHKRKLAPSIDASDIGPKRNPKPIPRTVAKEDLSSYVIPPSVIPSDADPQTPDYRVAVIKYYHRLKQKRPRLDRVKAHEIPTKKTN